MSYTTLKPNTKRAESFVNAYNRSSDYCLGHVYGRYSHEKARAERDCMDKMSKENGFGYKILSYNTCQFTCGWQVENGLRVETACNSYFIPNE